MAKNLLSELMAKEKLVKAEKEKKKLLLDADSLVAAIESGYFSKSEPEFKTKKSFAPSSLVWGSGACPRYWHLAFNGAVHIGAGEAKSIANMKNGTDGHKRIQDAIQNAGILIKAEERIVCDNPPIFGFCDVVIDWDGKEIPGEIKTMREENFAYRKQSGKPADYHVAQLLIYMRQLGKDLGVLIYESKNTHELMVIPVEMKPEYEEWLDYLYEWLREVRRTWKSGQLAKKPYRANSKVCKTCPMLDVCKAAKPGTVEIAPLKMLGDD